MARFPWEKQTVLTWKPGNCFASSVQRDFTFYSTHCFSLCQNNAFFVLMKKSGKWFSTKMSTPLFFSFEHQARNSSILFNRRFSLYQNENPTILFPSTVRPVIQAFIQPTFKFGLKWESHYSFSPNRHAPHSSIWPTSVKFWTKMRTPLFFFTGPARA